MIKGIYRFFIITGIAVGVVTGIFFICAFQNQLSTLAERVRLARLVEQNAKIILAPRAQEKDVTFSMCSISWEQYEKISNKIPSEWVFAPIAQSFDYETEVIANNTKASGIAVFYSAAELFDIKGSSVYEGRLDSGDTKTCTASRAFAEFYGVSVGDSISLNGEELRVTGLFEAPEYGQTDQTFFMPNNGQMLILPYLNSDEILINYVVIKKPGNMSINDFESALAMLTVSLNDGFEDNEYAFIAASDGQIFEQGFVGRPDTIAYLSIFVIAFLGEFVAGVNIFNLAKAGVLENKQRIGLMLATGSSYFTLYRDFTGEILMLCAKGALLGLGVSSVFVYYTNRLMNSFFLLFDTVTVALSLSTILLVALAASYVPFSYILKQQPAYLLKQEG